MIRKSRLRKTGRNSNRWRPNCDGRIQETWKVVIKPTSKIESASSLSRFWIDPPPKDESKRHASRLTPVLLSIEFTDGAVTARDTGYLGAEY